MPAVSPRNIVNALLRALRESGATAYYVSERLQSHPREFEVQLHDQVFSVWIYIWSLTPGGRDSLPYEYRIQMTSVESPLPLNPDGYTAILGYHGELEMFAGFDVLRHQSFTPGSSSIQIGISAIDAARKDGWSFYRKTTGEIAVGVRPDLLLSYLIDAESLHRYGDDKRFQDLLNKAAKSENLSETDINKLAKNRRIIVCEVSKLSRDAAFRKNVSEAYNHRCAVTGTQLQLLDAAHILPAASKQSSDDVRNGIALSPTIHRAYDSGLIFLDEDFVMRINQEKVDELRAQGLDGGLPNFSMLLNKRVHLPKAKEDHPLRKYVMLANKYRRIPGY